MSERERIVRHVAGCAVCHWLSRYAIHSRDTVLLDAAIRLRATHAANDAERQAFTRASGTRRAPQQAPGSSMRMRVPGGDDAA